MYLGELIEPIRGLLPYLLGSWGIFLLSMLWDMRRFRNAIFLMVALFFTIFTFCAFFGDYSPMVFLTVFLIISLVIFCVPALLMINGVHMLRYEGRSLANILSLVFGIVIGIGEICTVLAAFFFQAIKEDRLLLKSSIFTGMSVFFVCVLFLTFMLYCVLLEYIPHPRDVDYVIILGCGLLHGDQMSRLLSGRCDRAIGIYNKDDTKPIMIPSGGQGPDEKIPEAEAMAKYLLEHGVAPEHILKEDKSMNTMENLVNSKALIQDREGRKRTVIVTSNYHIYRALSYSRKLKFRCLGAASHTARYYWPSALIREFVAVMREKKHLIMIVLAYLLWMTPVFFM